MTRKPPVERDSAAATGIGPISADMDCEEHLEELLDEALDESFPASDPPSIARPPSKGC